MPRTGPTYAHHDLGDQPLEAPDDHTEAVWSNLNRSMANLTKRGIDQVTAILGITCSRTLSTKVA